MKNRLSVYTGSYRTFFRVSNLTESDSGRYQVLSRSDSWWFQLVVCSVKFPKVGYMASAELSAELHCEGAGPADNLTVQWFRWKPEWPWGWSRVFSEQTGSLNPLMSDLEGRVHMVENSSSLHISNINYEDQTTSFSCVVLDGQKTGNYTLVIPSLSLNHSGDYECRAKYGDNFYLFVSPEPEAQTELFSVGGRVNLSCNFDLKEGHHVVWFVRTARHHAHLSSSYSTLILSDLSLQDQGEYWCSVYPRGFPFENMCESTNKIVLIYQEPTDLSSTVFAVRASLVSCGLLGLVCAVVAVILKTRTREEDSHRTQTSY
uniref:Ig-like domain-containing protein n=1 Tax=Myripristis murdjan TaxID=586833 RepID=A0A667XY52_9TELE